MAGRSESGDWHVSRRKRRVPFMEYLRVYIPWLRKEADCNVCHEKMGRRDKVVRRECCGVWFHRRCVQAWREDRASIAKLCPGCYGDLDPPPPPRWPQV